MNVYIGLVLIAVLAAAVIFMINGIGLFAPSKRPRVEDDPEVINGHIARVSTAIGLSGAGAITYVLEGTHHHVPARSVDGAPIEAGTEVVIEQIENGTAVVERWDVVEQRI